MPGISTHLSQSVSHFLEQKRSICLCNAEYTLMKFENDIITMVVLYHLMIRNAMEQGALQHIDFLEFVCQYLFPQVVLA